MYSSYYTLHKSELCKLKISLLSLLPLFCLCILLYIIVDTLSIDLIFPSHIKLHPQSRDHKTRVPGGL